MARPVGTTSGTGNGSNRNNGGSSKDFAPSTAMQIRFGRVLESDLATIVSNGLRCPLCNTDLRWHAWIDLTIEHYMPRAAGGSNSADNVYYACRSCNSAKKDLSFIQHAFLVSATKRDPEANLALMKTRTWAQLARPITREHSAFGKIIWQAWRELSAYIRELPQPEQSRERYREITVLMVAERALALSAIQLKEAA